MDAARRHLAPVVQLLQWLQCFSSLGDDLESLVGTLQQLPRLTPQQLIHAVNYYRPEVDEKNLPKSAMKYVQKLQQEAADRKSERRRAATPSPVPPSKDFRPTTPTRKNGQRPQSAHSPLSPQQPEYAGDDEDAPEHLLLDPALMLPFSLPTSTDMLISYGAGFGGTDRERERKYLPTVPPEFLAKLDISGKKNGGGSYDESRWDDGYS